MKRTLKTIKNALSDKEFLEIIEELINNKKVQEMQKYRQHYDVTLKHRYKQVMLHYVQFMYHLINN